MAGKAAILLFDLEGNLNLQNDTGHFFLLCCYFSLIRKVLVLTPKGLGLVSILSGLENVLVSVGAALTATLGHGHKTIFVMFVC